MRSEKHEVAVWRHTGLDPSHLPQPSGKDLRWRKMRSAITLDEAGTQLLGTEVPMASDSDKQTNFSAADAALGYLYQVRLALLSSLQRLRQEEVFAAYLETLDDVVFERNGSPLELLQLKHHRDRTANLTDGSVDLWKSFRVWIEGRTGGRIPNDAQLYLITTTSVSTGSAASYLTVTNRDEARALDRLQSTATTSINKTNELAYKLFLGLSPSEKVEFIDSIVVVPKASNISSVGEDLRKEACLAVRRDHLDSFLSRLEGWWYRRAVAHLLSPNTSPILSSEIESEIDDLREQFKHDALPVDSDILKIEVEAAAYENTPFVHQVKLAGIGSKGIFRAIRDYYRAFEQRSRWVREELLLVGELDRYEQLLKEEWELQFDRVADELGEAAAEEAKLKAARKVYAWVEDSCFRIRPRVDHPSMTRGSFHILSDSLRVGWHPEFMRRLQHLLEPIETA